MMTIEKLYSTKPPYLYVLEATPSEITDYGWRIGEDNTRKIALRFLRGKKMRTVKSLFDETAAALQFPYYFGENWSAFDECIADLSWLPADVYVLIVTNAEEVLIEESEPELGTFTRILQLTGGEWAQAADDTGTQHSKPIAFHTIFQSLELGKLSLRLKHVDAAFEEFQRPAQ